MNTRIMAIAQKELRQLRRDRKTIPMMLLIPVIQVLLFGYVVGSDVKNIKYAVLDKDQSAISREITVKIEKSGYFINLGAVKDYTQLETAMDSGRIRVGLVIPAGFSRDIERRVQPKVQVLIDGTDSNTASVARGYFQNIIAGQAQQLAAQRLQRFGLVTAGRPPVNFTYRVYYNPELRAVNYMVPAITALVLLIMTTLLTALSVVREKELGTIEQIMVTPVKSWEYIVGKLLPYPFIGLVEVVLVVVVGALWFAVPIKGSLLLLLACSCLFLLTTLGIGLLISVLSNTQQQAMLTTIFFLIPNILLSGFIFPIANMPQALQWLTYFIPARYFIEIVRGIYLKGLGIEYLYPQIFALMVIGVGILGYSVRGFRKQVE